MTDYGHEPHFGAFIPPNVDDYERAITVAESADDARLDTTGTRHIPSSARPPEPSSPAPT